MNPSVPSAPPDGGARRRRAPVRKTVIRSVTVCLLLAFAAGVSTSSDVGRLTVVNDTEHFVHVIVDGEPFLYVPPGAGAIFEKEGYARVVARVFYSPGQGISGSAERVFTVAPYEPYSSGCEWHTLECTTTPASGGPLSWEVTADTLAALPPEGTVVR